MRTLSVKLSDGLDAKLTAAARRRKTSKSALVRKALEGVLREQGMPKPGSALDLVGDLVGCVAGPADLSVNKAHFKTFGR
ncbi:MAG: ribbon-helix-helix protein, CopG family [Candidatus Rokubacteria bacterium]|nr:ribbon-helix-helix protein, CopG family [Candidatus Rokubacteria bacterium]